ncbi:MAG: NAD(P)/FAD-dependent oxidoreductase [Clostridia bacterium]
MKSIIVAGCGHGGLVAAGNLAKAGYLVNVYEKKSREALAHDWTDIFNLNSLTITGIPLPPSNKYFPKEPMTLINPSKTHHIKTEIPPEFMEMRMERRDIYDHLLSFAESSGAKIHFNSEIVGAIVDDSDTVCGIRLKDKDIKGDLVIDACGLDSPVRKNLPERYNIIKEYGKGEKFYVYRAFYHRKQGENSPYNYKVYLFHRGEMGISWVADEGEYIDVLIGRLSPLTDEQIANAHEDLKEDNPCLGDEVIRGGQKVVISVRRPLPLFVGDNYAGVGDSAAMTIPLIGSGISNSIEAGKILADTIINNQDNNFSIKNLWGYQSTYMQLKYSHAGLDLLKSRLFTVTKEQADFAFAKKLLSVKDFSYVVAGKNLQLTAGEILDKAIRGISQTPLLLTVAAAFIQSQRLEKHAKAIPSAYHPQKVAAWINKYKKFK